MSTWKKAESSVVASAGASTVTLTDRVRALGYGIRVSPSRVFATREAAVTDWRLRVMGEVRRLEESAAELRRAVVRSAMGEAKP